MSGNSLADRYTAVRSRIIRATYPKLNPQQAEAVLATEGPLLILAGAGSGKTNVLIHRIAALLRFGREVPEGTIPPGIGENELEFLERYAEFQSPEDAAKAEQLCFTEAPAPWQIMAITFTNKAANELKERLKGMLGPEAEDIWASTFHSACVRILRQNIDSLGLNGDSFTIYDTADSIALLKRIIKELDLDEKKYAPRSLMNAISAAKNAGLDPDDCTKSAGFDLWKKRTAEVYEQYQKKMQEADALDFDDLLLYTVRLLENNEAVRNYYHRRLRYVFVDEYQDTNVLQYRIVRMLAGERKNLCVVGDDDQSIYRFRGATVENIRNFQDDYPGTRTIRLEQNYRSTGMILDAANAVIRENTERMAKTLWTKNERGERIILYTAQNENDEAEYVAGRIMNAVSREPIGATETFSKHAVLYRINALSNRIEYSFKRRGIPYRVYGGTRFYDRAEIKDMLAYLCVVNNPSDTLRLRRVINNPPRGIGDTAIERVQAIADEENRDFLAVLRDADHYPELKRSVRAITGFVRFLDEARAFSETNPPEELYAFILEKSGYLRMLEESRKPEDETRKENVMELKGNIITFRQENPEGGLSAFLDEMALYSDADETDDADPNRVTVMTIHSAKGLEFPNVYLIGADEGLFPGMKSIGDEEEMQEERRLCYVAITRAEQNLTVTTARSRMVFGRTQNARPSRFLEAIPNELLDRQPREPERGTQPFGYSGTAAPGRPGATSRNGGSTYAARSGRPAPAAPLHPISGKAKPAEIPAAALQLAVGDSVEHKAFGKGTVLNLKAVGPDCIIEIAFETSGTKKLMMSSAKKFMKKL